jgi:acetyl/propionyl-CoA carboxylase alpha subunit
MLQVIEETVILGVHANLPYLRAILSHGEFIDGTMTTQFIGRHFPDGLTEPAPSDVALAFEKSILESVIGAGAGASERTSESARVSKLGSSVSQSDKLAPWRGRWRLT